MVLPVPPHQGMLTGRALVFRGLATTVVLAIDLLIWGGLSATWSGVDLSPWAVVAVVAVMVLAYGCLALFRSALPGYLAVLGVVLCSLVVPAIETFAGFAMALFLLARQADRRLALLGLAGAAVPITLNTATAHHFAASPGAQYLLVTASLWTLLYLAAWVAGRMLAASDGRLSHERRRASEARQEALAEERRRISRELHDNVAHSLTAIVLQAAGARTGLTRQSASTDDLVRSLQGIESTAAQSMRELHRMLGILRSPAPEGAPPSGLLGVEDIDGLIRSGQDSGLDLLLSTTGTPVPLDPSVSHTAYRVVQEGLANTMKHAGAGTAARVVLEWRPATVVVTVHNGPGPRPQPTVSGGFGLTGLRERVDVVGGTLQAGPTEDGYLLQATVPVTPDRPSGSRIAGDGQRTGRQPREAG